VQINIVVHRIKHVGSVSPSGKVKTMIGDIQRNLLIIPLMCNNPKMMQVLAQLLVMLFCVCLMIIHQVMD